MKKYMKSSLSKDDSPKKSRGLDSTGITQASEEEFLDIIESEVKVIVKEIDQNEGKFSQLKTSVSYIAEQLTEYKSKIEKIKGLIEKMQNKISTLKERFFSWIFGKQKDGTEVTENQEGNEVDLEIEPENKSVFQKAFESMKNVNSELASLASKLKTSNLIKKLTLLEKINIDGLLFMSLGIVNKLMEKYGYEDGIMHAIKGERGGRIAKLALKSLTISSNVKKIIVYTSQYIILTSDNIKILCELAIQIKLSTVALKVTAFNWAYLSIIIAMLYRMIKLIKRLHSNILRMQNARKTIISSISALKDFITNDELTEGEAKEILISKIEEFNEFLRGAKEKINSLKEKQTSYLKGFMARFKAKPKF